MRKVQGSAHDKDYCGSIATHLRQLKRASSRGVTSFNSIVIKMIVCFSFFRLNSTSYSYPKFLIQYTMHSLVSRYMYNATPTTPQRFYWRISLLLTELPNDTSHTHLLGILLGIGSLGENDSILFGHRSCHGPSRRPTFFHFLIYCLAQGV